MTIQSRKKSTRAMTQTKNPPAMNFPFDGTASHQQDFNSHIEGRVGRLEGNIENLTHEVQETSKNVRELISGFSLFKENVTTHIGSATAPKWPLIVSFVSMIVTVLGLGGTIIAMMLSGQSSAIAKLDYRMVAIDANNIVQAKLEGRNESWRDVIEKKADKLDSDLQREMRLVDAETVAKVALAQKSNDEKFLGVQTQLSELHKWKLEHESVNAREHGMIDAQILQLQKDTNLLESRQYSAKK